MRARVLALVVLCVAACAAEQQQIGKEYASPQTTAAPLGGPETRWFAVTALVLLVALYDKHKELHHTDKWRKISRVFPSYELWRGHFSPHDKAGPGEICEDWLPELISPHSEDDLVACWGVMWENVGDTPGKGRTWSDRSLTSGRMLLRVLGGALAMYIALGVVTSDTVWVPEFVSQGDSVDLKRTCAAISASESDQGVYEHVDFQRSFCTGYHFGSMCHLSCEWGYQVSPHYVPTVVCGLKHDGNLAWFPGGDAAQSLCKPDLLYGTRRMLLHLVPLENAWKDKTGRGADAAHEPCWDDGVTCLLGSHDSANQPVPTEDGWMDLRITTGMRRSARASTAPAAHDELTWFAVIKPTENNWDTLQQVSNVVQFDKLEELVVDPQGLMALQHSADASNAPACNNAPAVLSMALRATSPTSGVLFVRLNGAAVGPTTGTAINLRPSINAWSRVVPLFKRPALFYSTKVTTLLLDDATSTFTTTAMSSSLNLGGLTAQACVKQSLGNNGYVFANIHPDSGHVCLALRLSNSAGAATLVLEYGNTATPSTIESTASATIADSGQYTPVSVVIGPTSVRFFADGAEVGTAHTVDEATHRKLVMCGGATMVGGLPVGASITGNGFAGEMKHVGVFSSATTTHLATCAGDSDPMANLLQAPTSFPTTLQPARGVLGQGVSASMCLTTTASAGELVRLQSSDAACAARLSLVGKKLKLEVETGGTKTSVLSSEFQDINDDSVHAVTVAVSGVAVQFTVDSQESSATLSATAPCHLTEAFVGHDGTTALTGSLGQVAVHAYALSSEDAVSVTCQHQDSVSTTLGHGGVTTPLFDTTKSFVGFMGDVVIYNSFLDPLVHDSWNLRRLEAIEWHFATKYGMTQQTVPSKPVTPTITSNTLVSQEGTDHARVAIKLQPQGSGYRDAFAHTLHCTDLTDNTTTGTPLQPGQEDVVLQLVPGRRYRLFIGATLVGLDACYWHGAEQRVSGDVVEVLAALS